MTIHQVRFSKCIHNAHTPTQCAIARWLLAHLSFYARIVNNLVDLVGCDARFGCGGSNIQHFSGQSAHLAHPRDALFIQDLNVVLAHVGISRDAIL